MREVSRQGEPDMNVWAIDVESVRDIFGFGVKTALVNTSCSAPNLRILALGDQDAKVREIRNGRRRTRRSGKLWWG